MSKESLFDADHFDEIGEVSLLRPESTAIGSRTSYKTWIFFILLGLTAVLATIKVAFSREFDMMIVGFLNFKLVQQFFRDNLVGTTMSGRLLSINYILAITLFLFLVVRYFMSLDFNELEILLGVFVILLAFTAMRILVLKLFQFILPVSEVLRLYQYYSWLVNKVIGVILIPFLFLMAFAPDNLQMYIMYLSIIVVLLLVIYKMWRALHIAFEYFNRYPFHFFLYICGFEIAPALIIFKLLSKQL